MPKQTFFNLPQAKRDAFVRIALQTFAEQPYEVASVSRIVAAAGIAKGSVYQYFDDKEDLFRYLLTHASETLTTAIAAEFSALPPSAGLFDQLRVILRANLRAAHAHPLHARLIQRAFTSSSFPSTDIVAAGNAERERRLQSLFEAAQLRGELRPEVPAVIAGYALNLLLSHLPELISTQLGRPLSEIDPSELDTPEVQALIEGVLEVLRGGLAYPALTRARSAGSNTLRRPRP
jgi:AcrR family transcriptional regulator